jgi:Animal haem peroxidase
MRSRELGDRLLVTAGTGRPAARSDLCLAPSRSTGQSAGYRRMFPDLDPLPVEYEALAAAGQPGGVCAPPAAAGDSARGSGDAVQAAGWPFFAQLIAHDITADRSAVGPRADTAALHNARSPKLDLEVLYGDGPVGHPYLYEREDPDLFLTAGDGWDVPRNSQGVALIGDPRDDVHLFVNQLHVTMLHAHNAIVALLRDQGTAPADVFAQARRALTWHYQWIVVHDFLPRLVGSRVVDEVLAAGGRHYAPSAGQVYLPLEFADAAFRYGHAQIRDAYRLQPDGPAAALFPDLIGFRPVSVDRRLDLAQIFDLPGRPPAQRAKRIDCRLPDSLISLPREVTGDVIDAAYKSLAVRDLMRGMATGLPSGEAVAAALEVPALTRGQLGPGWESGMPLWLYVLREAECLRDGDRLGPVGGCIVAEVIVGLLRADDASYLSDSPGWQPTLPHDGEFSMADLLLLAEAARRSAPAATRRAL